MNTQHCDRCGQDYGIGQWYQCPHDAYGGTAIGDEIVGGFVQEHFGHAPEVFYSKKAMLKRADALGLQPMVRHAGEHEKHLTNWAAGIDAYTLEAAAALVGRRAQASAEPPIEAPCESLTFTVREVK